MRHRLRVPNLSGARIGCVAVLTLAIGCCGLARFAAAEVHVSGTADALTIETRQATLEDVLQALRASVKLKYSSGAELHDAVNGTYSGSLPVVLFDLLNGHNYVFHDSADGPQLKLFGRMGNTPATSTPAANRTAAAPPPPPPLPPPPPPPPMQQTAQRPSVGASPAKECMYNGNPVEC